MQNILRLAVLTIFIASCGSSAKEEAEKARIEAEAQERIIEVERQSRERELDVEMNRLKNKKRLLQAEINLLEATGKRSNEQETRLSDLKKQLNEIN